MDIGSLTGQVSLEDQLSSSLTLMAGKVKSFAEDFDGMTKTVAVGAGIIGATIIGAVISITALGAEGSKLIGVQNAFDHLALSAGTTGDTLRGGLSAGVKGTVSDMQLMEATSKLLGSGMKLNADQATLMGTAARELGKATGVDAASGLETFSAALLTGRVRGLQQQIGLIDLAAGELKYANSIGVARDELDEIGKLEGKRIAILDATQKYVDRLGISQLSFGEIIARGKVGVEEWSANLAKAVAASPNVMAALDSIKGAFDKAFGGSSKTLLDSIMVGVNTFADAVTAAAPTVISFLGDLRDGMVWIGAHAYIFESLAVGIGAFVLVTTGVPAVVMLATGAMTFFTGGVTEAEIELENLKLALMGLPATATAAATGLESATITIQGFVATSGPAIVAIAGLTAVTMIGQQAWSLWNENAARGASQARQLTVDQANLATINRTLHTNFTDLGEAMQAANQHAVNLRATYVPLREAQTAVTEAARLHKVELDKVIDTLQKSARGIDLTSEAYFKLTTVEQLSYGAEKDLIASLDKRIEQNKALTAAEASRYDAITTSRLNIIAESEALLRVNGVTLQQIQGLKAHGLAETEIAEKLHTTVAALKTYETELTSVRDLRRQLADLEAKETQTSTQQAVDQHKREFEDAVANLDKTSAAYGVTYDLLDQIRRKKDAQERVDIAGMQAMRDNSLQETADRTYRTYSDMAAHASKYSRENLEEWRQKVVDTQRAVFGLGAEHAQMTANAQTAITATTVAQVGWNASIQSTLSMAGAINADLQSQIKNVETLAGEWLTAAEAKKAFDAGNTLDIATAAQDPEIMSLLKSGYSLKNAEAIKLGRQQGFTPQLYDLLGNPETAPSANEGVVGYAPTKPTSTAQASVSTLTPTASTTTSATTPATAATSTATNASRALFDQLNAQQAALYTAAGGVVTAQQQAIIDRMAPITPPGYGPDSGPYTDIVRPGSPVSGPVLGFRGSSTPQPATINLVLPDGRVLASVVTENMFGTLGLKV